MAWLTPKKGGGHATTIAKAKRSYKQLRASQLDPTLTFGQWTFDPRNRRLCNPISDLDVGVEKMCTPEGMLRHIFEVQRFGIGRQHPSALDLPGFLQALQTLYDPTRTLCCPIEARPRTPRAFHWHLVVSQQAAREAKRRNAET
jgi:hypothetical protein